MKSKTLKLKYPKNPGALLDKPEVQTYIWHLEDVGELDKLPWLSLRTTLWGADSRTR